MTETEVEEVPIAPAPKLPKRDCEAMTVSGDPCRATALAFVRSPVACGSHSTEEAKRLNRERWDRWVNDSLSYTEEEKPDDAIVYILRQATAEADPGVSVEFGYRPDAVAAMGKIAGARFDREDKCWTFPLNRERKVIEVLGRYFSEVVVEEVDE